MPTSLSPLAGLYHLLNLASRSVPNCVNRDAVQRVIQQVNHAPVPLAAQLQDAFARQGIGLDLDRVQAALETLPAVQASGDADTAEHRYLALSQAIGTLHQHTRGTVAEDIWALFTAFSARVLAELSAARRFKAYVHARLDAAGVDPHAEQNTINGCRIGARLDDLIRAAQSARATQPASPVGDAAEGLGIDDNEALARRLAAQHGYDFTDVADVADVADAANTVPGLLKTIDALRTGAASPVGKGAAEVEKLKAHIQELETYLEQAEDKPRLGAPTPLTDIDTVLKQAAAHHRCFRSLPEGYTHDDIDRLYNWAEDADDFLYSLSRAAALRSASVPAVQVIGLIEKWKKEAEEAYSRHDGDLAAILEGCMQELAAASVPVGQEAVGELAYYHSVELTEISTAISGMRPDTAKLFRRFFNDMKAGKQLNEFNELTRPAHLRPASPITAPTGQADDSQAADA